MNIRTKWFYEKLWLFAVHGRRFTDDDKFIVEEYDGDVLKDGFWDGHIFAIPESKKRN